MNIQLENSPYIRDFLINFANDLNEIGATIELFPRGKTLTLTAQLNGENPRMIREYMEAARLRKLQIEEAFYKA